jgi:hypothetical protein
MIINAGWAQVKNTRYSQSSESHYLHQLEEVHNICGGPPGDIFCMPAVEDHLSARHAEYVSRRSTTNVMNLF